MAKLSERIVNQAEAGEKDYFIWDDELRGFGLRVFKSRKRELPSTVPCEGWHAALYDRDTRGLDARDCPRAGTCPAWPHRAQR